jgi:hypothetical protein
MSLEEVCLDGLSLVSKSLFQSCFAELNIDALKLVDTDVLCQPKLKSIYSLN